MIQDLIGYDEIYSPFYWEDIDLSYRAYKRGWKVIFDSEIVVEHHHESTIGKYFDKEKIKTIAYRNQFFFQWKNITDAGLHRQHISSLPVYLIRAIVKKDWSFVKGFLAALMRLGTVGNKRKREIKESTQSDTQVLEFFK
jgi:GT2 family glycosyltransferase